MNTALTQIKLLGVLGIVCVCFAAAQAEAGTGGREQGRNATYIHHSFATLAANTGYVIETSNLSAGADTILHVQNYQDGSYLDGNDDCGTRLSGCTGYRSYVSILPTTAARTVVIIVRAYGSSSGGTATLRITPNGGTATDQSISFTAGYVKSFSSFRDGSHFFTVEEQGGSRDTYLLVTSQSRTRAIAYDDDDGVGLMSWIHAPEACSSNCQVIVGSYSTGTAGTTTFMWDEDIHTTNCDNDGMSDSLEAALGTSACNDDTDGDGIKDGVETMGIDDTSLLLRFPLYGADPLKRDVFIEADWLDCQPAGASDWSCGDPANPNRDKWRMPAQDALNAAAHYAPDVAVHIDTGVANSDPATWYTYGSWGGAARHTAPSTNKCDWLRSERVGYFHGGRLQGYSGGQGSQPGACFDTGYQAASFAHESGHNFNLSHGGAQSGSIDANCKPNYPSIMSYAILYDSSGDFSRGEFAGITLNPTQMNELVGLGTTDPAKLAHLQNYSFKYQVDPATGAVDWNRDGVYSSGTVRAAATWGWGGGGGCEQTGYQMDNAPAGHSYTALTRLPISAYETRIYWFTRRESDGKIEYRYATSFPEYCSSPPSSSCKTNWTPAVTGDGTLLSSSLSGDGAPAATWFHNVPAARYDLLLVYKDGSSRLVYQTMTPSGTWSSPAYLPGGLVVSGDPAVVTYYGTTYLYAVSGGTLVEWQMSNSGVWAWPTAQVWAADSSSIQAVYGIGLARGRIQTMGTNELLVAAIPMATPAGQIELAWKDPYAANRWTRLDSTRWQTGRAVTRAQPGLAYAPFDRDTSMSIGRFYLAWNPPLDSGGSPQAFLIMESEGNDLASGATSRRMIWKESPLYYQNVWGNAKGNISLLYDLSYDRNVHGAWTFDGPNGRNTVFNPMADGIYNGTLDDQDDYVVIRSNLRCTLGQGTCW